MKTTQFTELLATIKASFVSFFAIVMFVALGVGVFTGLYWSAPALEGAAGSVFSEYALDNYSISYPYGFTDDDRERLLEVDSIDDVVFSRESYVTYQNDDDRYTIKLQTLTETVNEPIVIEGDLPTDAGEIALRNSTAETLGLGVGDVMTFESDGAADDDGMTALNADHFTITALIESPEYLAYDTGTLGIAPGGGELDGVGWLRDDAFDPAAFRDGYPTVYLRSEELQNLDTFSEEYTERSEQIETKLSDLGDELAPQRFNDVKNAAQQQIDAARMMGMRGPEIDRNQADVDAMTDHGWTIAPRMSNGGISMVDTTRTMTDNLSFSMASLFVIVGLLVTYSTVSRLAHEQIIQIGTKKALGIRNREITTSFLLYSVIAVIVGVIVGEIAAVFLVEGILISAIGDRFIMGAYAPYFGIWLALIATAVELVLIVLSSWFACRSILREQAVALLAGEKPPEGKTRFYERWGVWNRLPLYTQTIVNNCINDTRRVVSTIIGVAGITALVVCAVTLNNDISTSFQRQYGSIAGYDTVVTFDPDEGDAAADIKRTLDDDELNPVAVYRSTLPLTLPDGSLSTAKVIVPESTEAFGDVFTIEPVAADEAADKLDDRTTASLLGLDGAWVSEAYRDNLGAKVGDTLTLTANDGNSAEVPIIGFFEFYLPHYEVLLDGAAYEKAFDGTATANAYLASLRDGVTDADLRTSLDDVTGFERVIAEKQQQAATYNSLTGVTTAVVLIYLALSVLMAIVVLLNLNVMFIEEKKRELIVLMINGFSVHDAKRYVYNDTILLTAIGIIVGLVVGALLGSLSVLSIQTNSMHFFSGIDWIAIAIGFVCSGALAAIMSAIALRRIPRFNLTDINKL